MKNNPRSLVLAALVAVAVACGRATTTDVDPSANDPAAAGRAVPGADGAGGSGGPIAAVGGCSDLFDENVITSYEVEIAADQWALIHDEFVNWEMRQAAGLDLNPYHAVTLHLGAESVPAWIRLKGNSSWFSAVKRNPNVKKQFVIAFDQGADTKARFHGVQKVELDMPSLDRTFLHERMAQAFLRDLGLPGLCANSAKLVVNGSYYGLYANLEYVNKDFLRRVFPGNEDGDLWKKRSDLQTNTDRDDDDDDRHDALWDTTDVAELATLMDMEGSLRTWAAEALLPQPDGYWGGNSNFYVYDHPSRGFLWLTDDLDATFDFNPADMHPLYFWLGRTPWRAPGPQYVALMKDPTWLGRFVDALAATLDSWNVERLQERVRSWSEQIADALMTDPNRPASYEDLARRQQLLGDYVAARPEAVRRWLTCFAQGGDDADADGTPWCLDCDDLSAAFNPGAPEICGDGLDQNCNGLIDDGCT